jgi:hypothetical protein
LRRPKASNTDLVSRMPPTPYLSEVRAGVCCACARLRRSSPWSAVALRLEGLSGKSCVQGDDPRGWAFVQAGRSPMTRIELRPGCRPSGRGQSLGDSPVRLIVLERDSSSRLTFSLPVLEAHHTFGCPHCAACLGGDGHWLDQPGRCVRPCGSGKRCRRSAFLVPPHATRGEHVQLRTGPGVSQPRVSLGPAWHAA